MTAQTTPSAAEDLRARVLQAAQGEPAPTRAVQTRRRVGLVAGGFAVTALLALMKHAADRRALAAPAAGSGRRIWHVVAAGAAPARPLGYVATLELVWLLVAASATWMGVMRGRSMLGRSGASKIAVAVATPVALIATWFVIAYAWLPAVLPLAWLEAMDDAPDFHFDAACALSSVVYAAGPLLAFFAMRRRRDPVSPRRAGAALGAVAGAWGAVVHFPFCQCTSPLHMAAGHVLPVVCLALMGALLGDRVLGVRAATA
ncbi:MAG: DUF1109 family protein [Myxococcales bacterium]|nr:DUF1109 family protein [Myxococcales bacterium]